MATTLTDKQINFVGVATFGFALFDLHLLDNINEIHEKMCTDWYCPSIHTELSGLAILMFFGTAGFANTLAFILRYRNASKEGRAKSSTPG